MRRTKCNSGTEIFRRPAQGIAFQRGLLLGRRPLEIRGEETLDGMKADVRGNLYLSAPGGVRALDPQGRYFGTILP